MFDVCILANSKTTSEADKSSFRCGVVTDSAGSNVSINNLFEKVSKAYKNCIFVFIAAVILQFDTV
jgi:hypothetical protein